MADQFALLDSYDGDTTDPFSSLDSYEEPPKPSLASDVGRLALQGVSNVGGTVGYGLEKSGIAPEFGRKLQDSDAANTQRLQKNLSPEQQAANAQPFVNPNYKPNTPEGSSYINPEFGLRSVIGNVVPSIPGTLAMGVFGSPLASAATKGLSLAGVGAETAKAVGSGLGYGASEGAFSGAQNAAQWGAEQRAKPITEFLNSPEFQQSLAELGDPEQAKEAVINKGQSNIFNETLVKTGGISALTGGGAFGVLRGSKPSDDVINATLKGIGAEAGQEAPQSYYEQIATNKATQQYVDPTQDPYEGAVNAAAIGGIAGGVLGSVGGAGPLVRAASRKFNDTAGQRTEITGTQPISVQPGNAVLNAGLNQAATGEQQDLISGLTQAGLAVPGNIPQVRQVSNEQKLADTLVRNEITENPKAKPKQVIENATNQLNNLNYETQSEDQSIGRIGDGAEGRAGPDGPETGTGNLAQAGIQGAAQRSPDVSETGQLVAGTDAGTDQRNERKSSAIRRRIDALNQVDKQGQPIVKDEAARKTLDNNIKVLSALKSEDTEKINQAILNAEKREQKRKITLPEIADEDKIAEETQRLGTEGQRVLAGNEIESQPVEVADERRNSQILSDEVRSGNKSRENDSQNISDTDQKISGIDKPILSENVLFEQRPPLADNIKATDVNREAPIDREAEGTAKEVREGTRRGPGTDGRLERTPETGSRRDLSQPTGQIDEKQDADEETGKGQEKSLLTEQFDSLSSEGLPLRKIEGNTYVDHYGEEVQDDYAVQAKPEEIKQSIDRLINEQRSERLDKGILLGTGVFSERNDDRDTTGAKPGTGSEGLRRVPNETSQKKGGIEGSLGDIGKNVNEQSIDRLTNERDRNAENTKDQSTQLGPDQTEAGTGPERLAEDSAVLRLEQPDKRIKFTTAKGSVYKLHSDGTTTRDKAYRPEHGEKEQGLQKRSQRTFFVDDDGTVALSAFQTKGGGSKQMAFDDSTGHAAIRLLDSGKIWKGTVTKMQKDPAVGLTPVEVWDDGNTVHFGNKITEISSEQENQDQAELEQTATPRTEGIPSSAVSDRADVQNGGLSNTELQDVTTQELKTDQSAQPEAQDPNQLAERTALPVEQAQTEPVKEAKPFVAKSGLSEFSPKTADTLLKTLPGYEKKPLENGKVQLVKQEESNNLDKRISDFYSDNLAKAKQEHKERDDLFNVAREKGLTSEQRKKNIQDKFGYNEQQANVMYDLAWKSKESFMRGAAEKLKIATENNRKQNKALDNSKNTPDLGVNGELSGKNETVKLDQKPDVIINQRTNEPFKTRSEALKALSSKTAYTEATPKTHAIDPAPNGNGFVLAPKEQTINPQEQQIKIRNKSVPVSQASKSILDEYGIKANVTPDKDGTVKITLPSKHATQSLTTLTKELRKSGNDILTGATENELFIYAKQRKQNAESKSTDGINGVTKENDQGVLEGYSDNESRTKTGKIAIQEQRTKDNAIVREKVSISSIDTPLQSNLATLKTAKTNAYKDIKRLQDKLKSTPLGGGRQAVQLEIIKAKDKHSQLIQSESNIKKQIEKRANELGQTTLNPQGPQIEQTNQQTEIAQERETPTAQAGRLDHGELNIPGRTNNINAELDQYKKAQNAQEKTNDKANLDDTKKQRAEISRILSNKDFVRSKAKALNKTVKDVEQAVNTMTFQAREKFIEAYNREQQRKTPAAQAGTVNNDRIKQALLDNKIIGQGGNAKVYDINGTDYVLRVENTSNKKVNQKFEPVEDPFEGRNFGQAIAKQNGMKVLRRQNGTPAGLTNYGKDKAKNNTDYLNSVKSAAVMPQEAYDKFADDLNYLSSKGYQFDPSKSNNVLISPEENKFNLVDINKGNYKSTAEDMLITLMGNTYAWQYEGKDIKPFYKEIYKKVMIAAKKHGLATKLGPSGEYSVKLANEENINAPPKSSKILQQTTKQREAATGTINEIRTQGEPVSSEGITQTSNEKNDEIESQNNEKTIRPNGLQSQILTKPKKQYLLDQKRTWLKEHKNATPQVKEAALKSFETNYETELDKASASIPFDQYKALPENKGQPEGVLKQAHEQLQKEYGSYLTDDENKLKEKEMNLQKEMEIAIHNYKNKSTKRTIDIIKFIQAEMDSIGYEYIPITDDVSKKGEKLDNIVESVKVEQNQGEAVAGSIAKNDIGYNEVVRFDEEGDNPIFEKPHGIYTTPVNVESPHQDVGSKKTIWRLNPSSNVLKLEVTDGKALAMRKNAVGAGAGVAAARELLGSEIFNNIKSLSKSSLIQWIANNANIKGINFEQYHDAQEVMEVLGAQLAKQSGYDSISYKDRTPFWGSPEFDEHVLLTENSVIHEGEAKFSQSQQSTGTTKAELTSWLDANDKKLLRSGKLNVVQSVSDLPAHLISTGNKQAESLSGFSAGVEALYDGKTKSIYLVSDNLTRSTLTGVILHEKLHAALAENSKLNERLLGAQSELNDIFKQVESGKYTGRYKDLYDAAMKRVDRAKTSPQDRFEEWLAYQVSEHSKVPQSLPERLAKAVQNLISTIKAAIFKYTGQIAKISPADLSALARASMNISVTPTSSNVIDSPNLLASRNVKQNTDNGKAVEQQEYDDKYPLSKDEVDGRVVLSDIPNRSSISATLNDYDILPGIREVNFDLFTQMGDLGYSSKSERERTQNLAQEISNSKEIKPLIVVIDNEGPYVLEGGHRFDALRELKAKSFPALVVIDNDSINESNDSPNLLASKAQAKEQQEYDDTRAKYFGTKNWMKAPNGKPTKLNEVQWVQTRTPSFMNWFGDWMNDPENASKVIDENGEPMVVYHGSKSNITEYDKAELGKSTGANSAKRAFFFAKEPISASDYAESALPDKYRSFVLEMEEERKTIGDRRFNLFTKIKSPENYDLASSILNLSDNAEKGYEYNKYLYHGLKESDFINGKVRDSAVIDSYNNKHRQMTVGEARSILDKNIDYTNELNKDIKREQKLTNDLLKIKIELENLGFNDQVIYPVFLNIKHPIEQDFNGDYYRPESYDSILEKSSNNKNDGAILKNTIDSSVIDDVFAVFDSNQIKSATGNTGAFSPESNDIRYSIRDDVRNMLNRNRQDESDPTVQLNRRIREQHKTVSDRAKQWLKREFSPGGLLPKQVFDLKINRDSEINAEELISGNLVASLDRAIKTTWGKEYTDLTQEQKDLIDSRLKGEAVNLPDAVKNGVDAMRLHIDRLSARYAQTLFDEAQQLQEQGNDAQAAAKVKLLNTIAGNIGKYVNRSYRAFDDENWPRKVPDDVLNNARDYFVDRFQRSENPAGDAQRVMNDILKTGTAYDTFEQYIKESKLGAKDLSVLIKRKDIAPEVRALLGEYKDARINFIKSATKMSRLLFNDTFLKQVKTAGLVTENNPNGFFFAEDNRPSEEHTVKIAADSSSPMAPLNGLYTYPEVNQAFTDALNKESMEAWYRAIVQANGLIKYGKTVLSPTTSIRNWMSAYFFTLANGHFDLSHMKESTESFKTYFDRDNGRLQYLAKLKRLGVVYDTPYAGEMMALLADSKAQSVLGGESKVKLKIKEYMDLATKFYQFGDDFWKIIGFENEKQILMKYRNMSEAEAETEAAKRIRDTYPTYSMVGRAVQKLRRFPLVGTFVSFPAEIIRTSFNMLKYAQEDMTYSKELGRRRIAGLAMVSGFAFAAQTIAMSLSGMDDDEEEALRDLAPPWSKNSNIVPLGRDKDGSLIYLDLSFLDPYNYFKRPLNAILRGQPVDETVYEVGRELLTPFFGQDIAFGALSDIWQNKKDSGGRVFNPNDTTANITLDIANHLRRNLQPGIASNIERLTDAITGYKSQSGKVNTVTEELAGLVGFRASRLNPKVALYYKSYEFQDKLSDASRILNDVARNPNKVSESRLKSAFDRARETRSEAFKDMHELVNAAKKSGLTDGAIRNLLKLNHVSKNNITYIMLGKEPKWTPGKTFLQSSIKKSGELFDQETTKEFERRRKLILSE